MVYNLLLTDAGWSSLAARRAHNPKVTGSNPVPATKHIKGLQRCRPFVFLALCQICAMNCEIFLALHRTQGTQPLCIGRQMVRREVCIAPHHLD